MRADIIPAGATINDLQKQAEEYEQQAGREPESVAAQLREKAQLCREWIKQLGSGTWSS